MRVRHFLDVKPHPKYAPSYVLGLRGKRSNEVSNEYEKEINFVSDEVSTKNIRDLERVSTVYFIQESHPDLLKPDVANLVCELKPHIQPSEAYAAVKEVDRIIRGCGANKDWFKVRFLCAETMGGSLTNNRRLRDTIRCASL